jgi:hypothetical protein
MAEVIRSGKKRVQSNDGRVQFNVNDNRILQNDATTYRFLIGDKPNDLSKVVMSKEGENVLNV